MPGNIYMRYRNLMLSTKQTYDSYIWSHGTGSRANIYGEDVSPEIQLVLKADTLEPIFYDNFELIGNDTFFEQITCLNTDQEIVEVIREYQNGQYRMTGRNYAYRNRRWFGNFPKFQEPATNATNKKERFVDGYMIVTFKGLPELIRFAEMKTQIRKAY